MYNVSLQNYTIGKGFDLFYVGAKSEKSPPLDFLFHEVRSIL